MAGIVFMAIVSFPVLGFPRQDSYATLIPSTGGHILQNLVDGTLVEPVPDAISAEHARFGLPVRLIVPKIRVTATVERVGVTSDGAMDVPKNFMNAAWYDLGPRPGEEGSAVIDGHFDRKNGKSAVFNNLHKLRIGDKLYVEDEYGATITFVVRESRRYGKNDDSSDVFSSNDGKQRLNLITCEGVWDRVSKSYSKRLVVFADKE